MQAPEVRSHEHLPEMRCVMLKGKEEMLEKS